VNHGRCHGAAVRGGADITERERRRCREASGGLGQHSAAARLCGEGVWSLATMGWTCAARVCGPLQPMGWTTQKGGRAPVTSANRTLRVAVYHQPFMHSRV